MKVIILAAGEGSRLRPYTKDRPKCAVELCGKALIDYQLDIFKKSEIFDITLVAGYKHEMLERKGIKKLINPKFASTNMVNTMMCARELFDGKDDVLITYGDIIYEKKVLDALLTSSGEITITIDKEWKQLWSLRMEDPLEDAETLILDGERLIELGKKPRSYDDIQGQYMGLIKVSALKAREFVAFWDAMDKNSLYDGNNFDNMYLTSLLQCLIDSGWFIKAVPVYNGWLEVDTVEDLEYYEKMAFSGELNRICDLKLQDE